MKTLGLLLLLAGIAPGAAFADDGLEAAIAAGNQDWVKGMETGNAGLAVRAYAPDAVDCSPKGDCILGHDAVLAKYQTRFAKSGLAKSAVVHSKSHVRDGEFVYEWGSAEFTGADGKSSSGRFLTVWMKQADGSWKIIRNIVLPTK